MADEEHDLMMPEFFVCKRCGLTWPMKNLKEVMLRDLLYPVNWCMSCFEDVTKKNPKIVTTLQDKPGEPEAKPDVKPKK